MRHRVARRKLGRVTPHRVAMLRNMATSFFDSERIRTTLVKAKELRPFAERLITMAKRDDRLHARRLVTRDIRDQGVVKKLFDTIGARFASRPGGYTRILRLGPRRGDGTEMAIIELLGSEYKAKSKDEKGKAASKEAKGEKLDKAKADKPRTKKAKGSEEAKA